MERVRSTLIVAAVLGVCAGVVPRVEAVQLSEPALGVSFTYPDTWTAYAPEGERVVQLRNFRPADAASGSFAPPSGGAVIVVQIFPPFDNAAFPEGADEYRVLDWLAKGNTPVARTSPTSGEPPRTTSILEGTRIVDTIVHRGARAFLIVLKCNADDPQVRAHERVLDDLIASLTVTDAAPTPCTDHTAGAPVGGSSP